MSNAEFVARGVQAAKEFMERRGYEIQDVNWECEAGQIDLAALDDDGTLVLAEVMTRKFTNNGFASDAVTSQKRDRLERLAAFYLKEHDFIDCRVRFDTLSLLVVDDGKAFLRHHINAFGGDPID